MAQDQKQAKDSAGKHVKVVQNKLDPREELGLKSPVKRSENETPKPPGKESRNDQ